ncbi:MAG TPA: hypothetical protein VM487_24155 [Phycisphaerae bacterium]|nr:hypothetical protein [Phycisphaerae bacterium]
MNDAGHPEAALETALSAHRWRLTRGRLLARLVAAAAAATPIPLLVVAADHAWPGGLPRPVIVGAALLWALGVGLTLITLLALTLFRRLGWLFVARHLERVWGIRHNAVVNALLVRRRSETAYACEGAARQAADALRTASATAPAQPRVSRKAAWVLLVVAVAWVLYAALAPKPILPSLARFFGADVPPPTATRLELVRPAEGDVVHAGELLEIEIAVRGRSVEEVWFDLLAGDEGVERPIAKYLLTRTPAADDQDHRSLTLAPHEVITDLHFRCRAGDAHLEGIIPVEPQPAVVQLQVHLVPPPHMGEPAETAPEPDLRVWAGTLATFGLRANVDVRDPVFILRGENETRTRMAIADADPSQATVSELLTESGTYRIEFTDRWGYACRAPAEHRIVVRDDAPPTVEIVIPAAEDVPDRVVDVSRCPELVAVASDDIRVSRVYLVHERGGLETRAEIENAADDDTRHGRVRVRVPTAELPLEPGRTLRVWFEAHDNRELVDGTPAAQVGVSQVVTLIRPVPEPVGAPDTQLADEPQDTESGDEPGAPVAGEREPEAGAGRQPDSTEQGDTPPQTPNEERATEEQSRGEAGSGSEQAPEEPDDSAGSDESRNVTDDGSEGSDSSAGSSESEFEREARAFEEEHGDEAREVARRLRESRQQQGADDAEQGAEEPQTGEQTGDDSGQASDAEEREPAKEKAPSDGAAEAPQERGDQQPQEGEDPDAGERETGAGEAQGAQGEGDDAKRESQEESPGQGKPSEGGPEPGEAPSGGQEQGGTAEGGAEGQDQPPGNAGERQTSGTTEPTGDGQAGGGADQPPGAQGQPSGQGGQPAGQSGGGGVATQPAQPESLLAAAGEADDGRPAPAPAAEGIGQIGSEGRQELLGLLGLLERGEEVSEELLAELGWSADKAAAFLRALERLQEAASRCGVVGPLRRLRAQGDLGTKAVQAGRGVSGEVSVGVGEQASQSDALEQIAPPPEQRVPPALQALLDAYYRALAQRREQAASEER